MTSSYVMLEMKHVMMLNWCACDDDSFLMTSEIEVRESFSEGIIVLITYFLKL